MSNAMVNTMPNAMPNEIPDYYRHLLDPSDGADTDPASQDSSRDRPVQEGNPAASPSGSAREETVGANPTPDSPRRYRADAFSLPVPGPEWRDGTIYTLLGPVSGGLRHNITIHVDDDTDATSLDEYAGAQLGGLEAALPEGRLLMHGPLTLDDETAAYRIIFRWQPTNRDGPLYQEQVYVYDDGCGYTLTSSFSAASRKRFGAAIESLLRRFRLEPARPAALDAGPSRRT